MLSFIRSSRAKKAVAAVLAATFVMAAAGCAKKGQQAGAQPTLVKTMQVIKRDTPLLYDYTGFVQAEQEMELKAQVSGSKAAILLSQVNLCILLINVLIKLIC